MYIDLYTSNLYAQSIQIHDQNLGNYSVTMDDRTIGDVDYKFQQNVMIQKPFLTAGTEIANAVTNPAGNTGTQYKYYYLKGGTSLRVVAAYYKDENQETWYYKLGVGLIVNGIEIAYTGIQSYSSVDPATEPQDYGVRFASFTNSDGKQYYGFVYGEPTAIQDQYCFGSYVSKNFFEQSKYDPFDNGADGSSPNGGYSDNDNEHTNPSVLTPVASIVKASGHGLHSYRLSLNDYDSFCDLLWSLAPVQAISRWLDDPFQSIVSLQTVPSIPGRNSAGYPNTPIRCGKAVLNEIKTFADGENIFDYGSPEVPVGTFAGNSFLDWADTKAILYLPFCGTYPVDIKLIMGGSIQLMYMIDILQGNCVCTVYGKNWQGRETILGTYSGNCAVPYPITGRAANAGIVPGVIETLAGVGGAVLTGGTSTLATIGAATAVGNGLEKASKSSITVQGNLSSNSAAYASLEASLTIIRPNPIWPSNYNKMNGRPSGKDARVNDFKGSGFLSGTVYPKAPSATFDEIEALKRAFKEGVYV